MTLTVVNGDLVHATYYSRHYNFQICGAKIILRCCLTSVSKIQLSAHHHCFFYSPVICTNSSPSSVTKNFHSTFEGICTTSEPNLGDRNRAWNLRLETRFLLNCIIVNNYISRCGKNGKNTFETHPCSAYLHHEVRYVLRWCPPTQRHYFRILRQFTNSYHFFVAIEGRCKTNWPLNPPFSASTKGERFF